VLASAVVADAGTAGAAEAPVGLGTAKSFGVLAGSAVTNTGPTVINSDLGTCPSPAITGFPPGEVKGTIHAANAVACQAQSDLTTAFNDAAGRAPNTTYPGATELGGLTLTPGVYKTPTSLAITGALTLNGQGDPDAVFIFQAGSTLLTAVDASVVLINGTQACNVFWQVGSSATLGVRSAFIGTILAFTSISANTRATVQGRLMARNGAVTLDTNTVTTPACATTTPNTSSTGPSTSSTTSTPPPTTSTTAPNASSTDSAGGGGGSGGGGAGANNTSTTLASGNGATPAGGDARSVTAKTGRGGGSGTSTFDGTASSSSTELSRTGMARTGASVRRWLFWGGLSTVLGSGLVLVARRKPSSSS